MVEQIPENPVKDASAWSLLPERAVLLSLGVAMACGLLALQVRISYPEAPSEAHLSLGAGAWLRLGLVALGTVLAGLALRLELLRHQGWPAFPDSATAALICIGIAIFLMVGSLALVGEPGTERLYNDNTGEVVEWKPPGQLQSIGLVCRAGMVVALVGGFLLVIPEIGRRLVLVLVLCFHFGGILSAVLSVPPPGGNSPWMVSQVWTYVYRPYLQFIYQNNAYHFYSPEPGPPSFLWFRLDYTDGSRRWYRIPDAETSPIPMHFQRMLSIGESSSQTVVREPGGYRTEEVLQRMGQLLGLERLPRGTIAPLAWREPQPNAKHLMCSYMRHVMGRFPHPDGNQDARVIEGHLWRVVHTIIQPGEIAYDRRDPTDRRFYVTVYQGEYDDKGILRDPNDPLLYWMMQAYDKQMIESLAVQAQDKESEVRRMRDLRGNDLATQAQRAVMAEDADALNRFQSMLRVWLKAENPVIDFFKLQADTTSFPPQSVWDSRPGQADRTPGTKVLEVNP